MSKIRPKMENDRKNSSVRRRAFRADTCLHLPLILLGYGSIMMGTAANRLARLRTCAELSGRARGYRKANQ